MNITKNLVANFSSREGYKPTLVVVHISAGSLTSMTNWFSTPNSQASAHYGIGKDGNILMYVEESNKAWANGRVNNPSAKLLKKGINPNLYSISIENEGQDLQYAPEAQRKTLYSLISDICKRNGISIDRDHIIGHYEIDALNRPYCPSPDHTLLDKIVENVKLLNEDPLVCLKIPQSKVGKVLSFINTL